MFSATHGILYGCYCTGVTVRVLLGTRRLRPPKCICINRVEAATRFDAEKSTSKRRRTFCVLFALAFRVAPLERLANFQKFFMG